MNIDLDRKAMIANLTASMWIGTKQDKSLSKRVNSQHIAHARKQLVDKKAIADVQSTITHAKMVHNHMTLPWRDNGERLLPLARIETYEERMAEAISGVERARREFASNYTALIDRARNDMGTMFREEDYPRPDIIERKFGVSYELLPVPRASHVHPDIANSEIIASQLEISNRIRLEYALAALRDRVESALRKMIDSLGDQEDGNPRRVHQSILDNLLEIADSLPAFNITDDESLKEISGKIKQTINGLDVNDLRYRSKSYKDVIAVAEKRESLSKDLNDIASAYFGNVPE